MLTGAVEADFWSAADHLVSEHKLVIDRPRGSQHPRYPNFVYPLDYGYLEGTTAADGGGIDVWRGSAALQVQGVLITLDLVKRDAEVKLLLACTAEEMRIAHAACSSEFMQALLCPRPSD